MCPTWPRVLDEVEGDQVDGKATVSDPRRLLEAIQRVVKLTHRTAQKKPVTRTRNVGYPKFVWEIRVLTCEPRNYYG
jgi:hypothetical protein